MPSTGTRVGGHLLAEQLVVEGVEVIFGIPGAQLDHAVDGLAHHADTIRFVHTRHEQGCGYMADGYARTTGRPGVMMVVPGPGLLNASAALATAWACSSPVVAIVGAIPTWAIGINAGVLHELRDQSAILREITSWHHRVSDVDDIPAVIAEAFAACRSGRPRPAAVEIPADLLAAETSAPTVAPRPVHHRPPDVGAIATAAELLEAASFPVVVVGNGVTIADAGAEALVLAERLGAPVVVTTNGKAAVRHDHPLVVPQSAGRDVLAHADSVLAVGTRLVNAIGRPVTLPPAARLVVLNADPTDLGGWRDPAVAIHADARLGLQALNARIAGRRHHDDHRPVIEQARAEHLEGVGACGVLAEFVDAVRTALPHDAIVVSDLTQAGYLANAAFPVFAPRSYLTSGWQGTLGFSYPTALGAKVAHPDRAVVALIGDGGFGFTLAEMATAKRHAIAAIAVCFRDDAYGNVRRTQADVFGRRFLGTDLDNPDFAAVAEAHGLSATRVSDPHELESALRAAIDGGAPAVIEVSIGEVPSPWHLFSDRPFTAD